MRTPVACIMTATFLVAASAHDVGVVGAAEPSGGQPERQAAPGQRIFFTGHSYTYGSRNVFDEIAKSAGFKDHVLAGHSTVGGSRVIDHYGVKHVMAALAAGSVDVLLTTPIYLPDPGIEKFARFGLEHNPDFRLFVIEFWLPYDNYEPRNYTDGPKGSPTERVPPPRVDHDAATVQELTKMHQRYFDEMDAHVVEINKQLGKPVGFVMPVGQAVIALRERIIAGQAPGLKTQSALFTDELGHPAKPLRLLMVYCGYAVVYRKNPVGLPASSLLADAEHAVELSRLLQELAWDSVTHHPLSGVTAATNSPSP